MLEVRSSKRNRSFATVSAIAFGWEELTSNRRHKSTYLWFRRLIQILLRQRSTSKAAAFVVLLRCFQPLVMRRIPWPAVSTEWTSEELLDRLNNALSHCTSNDVVITGTGQHDRSLPFTLVSFPFLLGIEQNWWWQWFLHPPFWLWRFQRLSLSIYSSLPSSAMHVLPSATPRRNFSHTRSSADSLASMKCFIKDWGWCARTCRRF